MAEEIRVNVGRGVDRFDKDRRRSEEAERAARHSLEIIVIGQRRDTRI